MAERMVLCAKLSRELPAIDETSNEGEAAAVFLRSLGSEALTKRVLEVLPGAAHVVPLLLRGVVAVVVAVRLRRPGSAGHLGDGGHDPAGQHDRAVALHLRR